MPSRSVFLLFLLLAAVASMGSNCGGTNAPSADTSTYAVQVFPPAADLEDRLRIAAQFAEPGTIFELPAGTYSFVGDITFDTSHLVIRGQGMDQTILDFSGQQVGSQGFLARGDHFTVQDFTIRDPAGNGIKTEFITGATYERVKVEWTGGPSSSNGAYGFYPNQSQDILIDSCIVIGARDAGIYVGQSKNIIVRNSEAYANVIGIEIENSIGADVYNNITTGNTLGVGIFNLPNLQIKNGKRTRLFNNMIADNNLPNFASGGLVGSVPGGSGVIVIANDEVDIFNNTISNHETSNLFISSYFVTLEPVNDAGYDDPYAEGIYVHDNVFVANGTAPQGLLGNLVANFMGIPVPDIGIGGFVDPAKIPGYDPNIMPRVIQLPDPLRICIRNNGAATFGSVNGFISSGPAPDISQHDCALPALPPIVLPPVPAPPTTTGYTPAEIDALCNAPGTGINWAASEVNCPDLRSYRLFDVDPRDPRDEGLHYQLTTQLFVDYTHKHRFIFLPPGAQMQYRDIGPFDMPIGTIILKTFSFETPPPDAGLTKIETRLLIHRADGWHGLGYLWDTAGQVATYTPQGATLTIEALDDQDRIFQTNYSVPARTDCGSCHFGNNGDSPIGPKAGLLNGPLPFSSENQLSVWEEEGFLAGSPGAAAAPQIPAFDDPTESIDDRARAYLESNCAHCHNPAGRARFTGLWLEYERPVGIETGLCKQPVAAGSASLGLKWDVNPGHAEESILWARVNDTRPGIKMPELGKSVVHEEGVELLRLWINQLPGSCGTSMMTP